MTRVERSFEDLIAEAVAEPPNGWDFSWFEGRATEQRPSWGYTRLLEPRVAGATAVLDIQTGGGEVFAKVLERAGAPPTVAATESWWPNVALAKEALQRFGGTVTEVDDAAGLPFADGTFDLVISRHPTVVVWPEIARVLGTGGSYVSQQVGAGSNRELTDFMMGPQPVAQRRSPERAVSDATSAGLEVLDLRTESLELQFFDVGAVVYFLRKVLWTVPGFNAEKYRNQLLAMDREIRTHGAFVSHAQRFLIEATKS
jgi:SAM-dependent methyltransferase